LSFFSKRSRIWIPLLLTGAVVAFLSFPRQEGDPDFDARVSRPAYPAGSARHPIVLIDQAHLNIHKAGGRYKPFADLIRNDGYDVRPNRRRFALETLAGCDVLVISNAMGFGGAFQQILNTFRIIRFEGRIDLTSSAFSRKECRAVSEWVRRGGSLLLVADHAPAGKASAMLAAEFGVGMTNSYVEDEAPNHDAVTDNWGFLVFSRANGLLGDHPVTLGRGPEERADRVVSFTGQGLKLPPDAVSFLTLSKTARDYAYRGVGDNDFRPGAGLSQGAALAFGLGRVVVLGEAAMLTSQKAGRLNLIFHFGLDWPDSDNRKLALNIMHWLSRLKGM